MKTLVVDDDNVHRLSCESSSQMKAAQLLPTEQLIDMLQVPADELKSKGVIFTTGMDTASV